jgi:hypothetical protein
MSINYSTLFSRIGKFIKYSNIFLTNESDMNTAQDAILDQYNDRRDLVTNVYNDYLSFINTEESKITKHIDNITTTLQDLQVDLFAPDNSINTIFTYMYNDMVANSESVNPNIIGSITITPDGTNVGTGTLKASKTDLLGADDERIKSETIKVNCIGDMSTGSSSGNESFEIVGNPIQNTTSYLTQGSGTSSISPLTNLLINGSFDTFTTANTPDNWTISGGVVGTHIFSTATSFRGAKALKLKGNSVLTGISLYQAFPSPAINTFYNASVWIKKGASVPTGATLTISITGTGMAAIVIATDECNDFTTSYVNYNIFFSLPDPIPTDLAITIAITSANNLTSSDEIYIDELIIGNTVDFGHVQYALIPGSTDFLIGDNIGITTVRTSSGVIQGFFTRYFNTVLHSDATESINDSVAT